MTKPGTIKNLLRLPSRIALLLGCGALSATAAQASTSEIGQSARVPQQSAKSFGALRVWSDAGRIFTSEPGQRPRELQLGNTPEAAQLRQLLERSGASAESPQVLQERMILVGGGGAGISWAPANRDRAPGTSDSPAATGFGQTAPAGVGQTAPIDRTRKSDKITTRKPQQKG
jgi:hypothetical protein